MNIENIINAVLFLLFFIWAVRDRHVFRTIVLLILMLLVLITLAIGKKMGITLYVKDLL